MSHTSRLGFAWIQAIVAIAVLLTFGGFAVVYAQQAREQQMRNETTNNLKQCCLAAHTSHDMNKKFPTYYGPYMGKESGTFHYYLLPFLEHQALFENHNANAVVAPFIAGEDPTRTNNGAGAANFPVNLRLFFTKGGVGELSPEKTPMYPTLAQLTTGDGASRTLMLATKYQHCGATGGSLWLDPGKNALNSRTAATFGGSMQLWQKAPKKEDCDPTVGTAVSFTDKVICVALCDGSVHVVTTDLSRTTWQALHTWNGRDEVGKDFWGK